tara:strand:+ start:715 stop:1152 length:438 start_codon:yes stop_codon:yes gene_type:complete
MSTRTIKDPTFNIYAKGGNVENKNRPIDKEQLMKLAKDEADILFDLENDIIEQMKLDYIKEGGKGQSFTDWLKSKPKSYLRNIPLQMSKGGKVIMLSDYLKQKEPIKIKKINLDAAAPGKTLFDLTDAEREVVNKLLRMSFRRDE